MGADGHIIIWKDEEVREEFPECDKLFECLPTYYRDELDGNVYHHCYWGDNLWLDWTDNEDWYLEEDIDIDNLRDFVVWLEEHGTHWEVWT
jgi:hypothetical protein